MGQVFLTKAYAAGVPSEIAVISLTQVIFGLLLDIAFWGRACPRLAPGHGPDPRPLRLDREAVTTRPAGHPLLFAEQLDSSPHVHPPTGASSFLSRKRMFHGLYKTRILVTLLMLAKPSPTAHSFMDLREVTFTAQITQGPMSIESASPGC